MFTASTIGGLHGARGEEPIMRIALLTNSFDAIGGAEKFAVLMARELDADIITTSVCPAAVQALDAQDLRFRSIGQVPRRSPWRQEALKRRFSQLKLTGYDVYFICGDWAVWAAPQHRPNVWYCHSPNREMWDLSTYTRSSRIHPFNRPLFDLWVTFNRVENQRRVRSVDRIIANSRTTALRVEHYLGRESTVVYPPVIIPDTRIQLGTYWLSVNRLVPQKRIELQIEAFRATPEQELIILAPRTADPASRSLGRQLTRDLPPNIRLITSALETSGVEELYRSAKGVLATAKDEDFGLSIIEGFAHGKPAVAVNEGGFRESVTPSTGILVSAEPGDIARAISTVSLDPESYASACRAHARLFSLEQATQAIRQELIETRLVRNLI
jgi:glycosyltransferase involved in cell wall biosynthesis